MLDLVKIFLKHQREMNFQIKLNKFVTNGHTMGNVKEVFQSEKLCEMGTWFFRKKRY